MSNKKTIYTEEQKKIIKQKLGELFSVLLDVQLNTPYPMWFGFHGHVEHVDCHLAESMIAYSSDFDRHGLCLPYKEDHDVNIGDWCNKIDSLIAHFSSIPYDSIVDVYRVIFSNDIFSVNKKFDSEREANDFIKCIKEKHNLDITINPIKDTEYRRVENGD